MHDPFDRQRLNDEAALAAALRALPDAQPPRDGWERLAARLQRHRRVRTTLRIALPAALAAGIAVAVVLPHLRQAAPSAPQTTQTTGAKSVASADLTALRLQSGRLQAWVRTLDRDGAPLDGSALAGAVALQDRIGLVDLQLTAATDPAARASLWQQRIDLLQRLGMLHLQAYSVAERSHAAPNETMIL